MIDENIHKLLAEINKVCLVAKEERKAKLSRGECYNVFNVIGLRSEEVRLHSTFLAELLNPQGSHGLGDKFLKAFLRQANLSEDYINVNECDTENIVERSIGVTNEDKTEGGRIDIIIEDGSRALIIENKIYAGDQENQLLRYHNYAQRGFGAGFQIIYLTLNGHKVSEYSLGNGTPQEPSTDGDEAGSSVPKHPDHKCMSYREDIISWLTECARLAFDHPLVRETINQYIQLIKQLTDITMEDKYLKEVAEIAVQNIDSTLAIYDAQYEISIILIEKYIFDPLREYAQSNNLKIEIANTINLSKKNWKGCICVDGDKNWNGMFIKIICNDKKGKSTNLTCLSGPANERYPYGWEYVNVRDWGKPNSFRAIIDGEVVKWLMDKIDAILQEIGNQGIEI